MAYEQRLIDIEQAKRATYEEIFWTESEQAVVRNFLAKLPKVDAVEVVHGRWVEVDDGVLIGQGKHFECSECKLWAMPWQLSNYCPNCGAKMDGGDEDG